MPFLLANRAVSALGTGHPPSSGSCRMQLSCQQSASCVGVEHRQNGLNPFQTRRQRTIPRLAPGDQHPLSGFMTKKSFTVFGAYSLFP